ncbi:hypothetical protein SAMN02927924_01351 [Sphingobium faniae]|nr:hypothetical protein SAMN02927924_01351 [Sphingobium faniae]
MTPTMRARLQDAMAFVLEEIRNGSDAADIIAALVGNHRAHFRRGDPNTLRVAGITASCSYSAGAVLLDRWRGNATVKLMEAAQ